MTLSAPVKRVSVVWSKAVAINEARIVLLFTKEKKEKKKRMKYNLVHNLKKIVLNFIFIFPCEFRILSKFRLFQGGEENDDVR